MTDKEGNEIEDINDAVIKELETRKLSYSSLKAFKRSPMHFAYYLFDKFDQTPAMVLGSVFDVLVLTPGDFAKKYVVSPVFKGKGMKVDKAEFIENNPGREIITMEQFQTATNMCTSLMENEIGWNTINYPGKVQKKIEWTDKGTGLMFKGYIDKYCDEYNQDLKSCADGEPSKFMRDAYNMDYPLQAAMYNMATGKLFVQPFIYVCVESKAPHGVSVFTASNEYIEYGYNEYKRLTRSIKFCIENRQFHRSYDYFSSTDFYTLDLPGYAKYK